MSVLRCLRETLLLCGLFATLIHVCKSDEGHHWSYKGETDADHWPEMYETCAGEHQSPINIEYSSAEYNPELRDMDFINNADENTVTLIGNNGHTLSMATTAEVLMDGAGLPDTYKVAQAHFHWGSDSTKGSEHQRDGASYPLEMHVVTYNFEKYSELADVFANGGTDESALAVFGVFFKVAAHNNTKLDPLLKHFEEVQEPGEDKATVTDFHLWDLLPNKLRDYYRYSGSLTTPTCNEVVVWTLFHEENTISEAQLTEFRRLSDGQHEPLVDNWRPVQLLNARKVEKSFKAPSYDVVEGDSLEDDGNSAVADYSNFPVSMLSVLASMIATFIV